MAVPAFTRRVLDILKENREEIAQAARTASESRSKLMKLLKVDEFTREVVPWGGGREGSQIQERMEFELQYLIDLFDAYIDGGQDPRERLERMGGFAENYHKHPDEVKEVLDYVGLEI